MTGRRGIVTETIQTALFPGAPEGSTPDALAVAADGKTLFVANADNNCVAVIDVSTPSEPGQGLHPHGLVSHRGRGHSGRQEPPGRRGQGEPDEAQPDQARGSARHHSEHDPAVVTLKRSYPYIGTTLSGSLSIVPVPDDKTLAGYTETVYKNCPYSDKLLTDAPHPEKTAIPPRVGDPSPIEHVLYIIKENRTYDQVFGDLTRGNGDPSLVMFGRDVTPNHHKLAEEFVLLDNLYCNGHVSADGHPWSTMAYNTDYIARNWALTYSSRAGVDDDDRGDLSNAPSGYLWDACARGGSLTAVTANTAAGLASPMARSGSKGPCRDWSATCAPITASPGPRTPQPRHRQRRDVHQGVPGIRENGNLPRFMVMSLGEDSGTAGLVRQVLGTEIHKFRVNGQDHWANAGDPQIPAALKPVIGGICLAQQLSAKAPDPEPGHVQAVKGNRQGGTVIHCGSCGL